jgi:ankyrin repeat protein
LAQLAAAPPRRKEEHHHQFEPDVINLVISHVRLPPLPPPPYAASQSGHADVALALLDAGAEIDNVDILKRSSLYIACGHGHYDVVQLLVARGANLEQKFAPPYTENTALCFASSGLMRIYEINISSVVIPMVFL